MKKIYIAVFSLIALTGLIVPQDVKAQVEDAELKSLIQRIDSLKEAESVFRFGLSVGPRVVLEEKIF